MAFRKHVLPMLHIPRPSSRRGVFVATLLAVPCSGFGLTFSLRVGSRRVTVSGQEVRTGEEVVEAFRVLDDCGICLSHYQANRTQIH